LDNKIFVTTDALFNHDKLIYSYVLSL